MDAFVQNTSDTSGGNPLTRGQCDIPVQNSPANDYAVMDYYDGNTVTGLWNYAQHFAMSDNSFGTTYGPSTPGALNVTVGNTYPTLCAANTGTTAPGGGDPDVYDAAGNVKACPGGLSTLASGGSSVGSGTGTMVSDADPYFDACANGTISAAQGGRNVGDLLNDKSVTWGWFEGGFSSPNYVPGRQNTFDASTICRGNHYNIGAGAAKAGQPCTVSTPAQPIDAFCTLDYSPHHEPFQYFASTSNPQHLPPTSIDKIGKQDRANHQYDLKDFWSAVDSGNMPAVSYLKAERAEDGHAHNSSPLDEQRFLVQTINHLQQRPEWDSTMVAILWDDSDGWYDHALAPLTTQSHTGLDTMTNPGQCGTTASQVPAGQQARCGLGPRLPLLIVSPFAQRTSSTTPRPTRARLSASSRTTGISVALAAGLRTPARARSPTCSTSTATKPTDFSSIPPPGSGAERRGRVFKTHVGNIAIASVDAGSSAALPEPRRPPVSWVTSRLRSSKLPRAAASRPSTASSTSSS